MENQDVNQNAIKILGLFKIKQIKPEDIKTL